MGDDESMWPTIYDSKAHLSLRKLIIFFDYQSVSFSILKTKVGFIILHA